MSRKITPTNSKPTLDSAVDFELDTLLKDVSEEELFLSLPARLGSLELVLRERRIWHKEVVRAHDQLSQIVRNFTGLSDRYAQKIAGKQIYSYLIFNKKYNRSLELYYHIYVDARLIVRSDNEISSNLSEVKGLDIECFYLLVLEYLKKDRLSLASSVEGRAEDIRDFLIGHLNIAFRDASLLSKAMAELIDAYASNPVASNAAPLIAQLPPKFTNPDRQGGAAIKHLTLYSDAYQANGIKYREDLEAYDPKLVRAVRSYCNENDLSLDVILPRGDERRAYEMLKTHEPGSEKFEWAITYLADRKRNKAQRSKGKKPTP